MTETTTQIAAGLSAATTGAATPDHMTVARPTRESVWTLIGALAVLWTLAAAVVWILGFGIWPGLVADRRVATLGYLGEGAVGCIGVIIVALASSRLGRIDASAGPAHIAIDGRQGDDHDEAH